ncbi:MAG: CYTH domain-containing protein [Agathobacter sp.]|nr:CYTH domain-containing protein [Agathobacter sp.]
MEIERKFLVKNLPDNLENYEQKHISQGYLCTNPVVRIRRSNDEYFLTYKGKGLMAREEHEFPLSAEAFEHMLPKIDGILIDKIRYLIPLDETHTAELDIFQGVLEPLRLVEVEFASLEETESFVAPDWFGDDVTNAKDYHNSNLSQR